MVFTPAALSAPLLHRTISSAAACLAVHTIFCSMLLVALPSAVSTGLMLLPSSSASSTNFYRTACAFPSLDDPNGCQRDGLGHGSDFESDELLNGWFCDPESTISMSEVFAVDETLRRIYEQNRQNCICAAPSPSEENIQKLKINENSPPTMVDSLSSSSLCWFRFGFAFVPELSPGPDVASAEHCTKPIEIDSTNNSSSEHEEAVVEGFSSKFLPPETSNMFDAFSAFADNYARVLRQRWHLGECGEDILILVVQKPPQKLSSDILSSDHSRQLRPMPLIFLSFGPMITHRLHPDFGHALQHILLEANLQLQRDARPLFKVLSEMLVRMDAEVLGALATEFAASGDDGTRRRPFSSPTQMRHRHDDGFSPSRNHIPLWAWAVFGACGIAFGLMGLGLFLIRTRTRRGGTLGGVNKKQQAMMVSRRHWRESSSQFGKDEQPPPTTTYVNLVQLLMPHPKPPQANMPQQV